MCNRSSNAILIMEVEERKVKTIEINIDNYENWLLDNRPIILTEIVNASEYLIENELDEATVVRLLLNTSKPTIFSKMMQIFKIYKEDLEDGLDKVMDSCIEYEEYELAQRVKELQEFIKEYDI